MKIEIGESLGYSYLRHVKQCWLVQTNWKASAHWTRHKTDEELKTEFLTRREGFDRYSDVFKQTTNVGQFLKQAEIDVLGVDLKGNVYALEVAFHENGLNYGSGPGTRNTVLKKSLRTMLALRAYHPPETKLHICFASPKVNPAIQGPLKDVFESLQAEYPEVEWELMINQDFTAQLVTPTLEMAGAVADTTELFVRATKLLDLTGTEKSPIPQAIPEKSRTPPSGLGNSGKVMEQPKPQTEPGLVQPIVQSLMKTLLEDYPTLLTDVDIRNLMNRDYCQKVLGFQLGGFPLLRKREAGRRGSDNDNYARYYFKLYAGKFYVCSQWWRDDHLSNAKNLLRFVTELAQKNPNHPGVPALERHKQAFLEYIG